MSDRWAVLVPESVHPDGVALLESFADVTTFDEADGYGAVPLDRFAALVVRIAEVDAAVLDRAASLRVVSKHGIGLDNVDVAAATERGIPVCNLPTLESTRQSVAEHVVAAFLSLRKRLPVADRETKAGGWHRNRYAAPLADGDVMGLFGIGNIGTRTAELARGIGMECVGYDPYVPAAEFPEGVGKVGMDELFRRSDAVSVHAPLTDETRGAIGEAEFDQFAGGILINAARGPIVEQDALVSALEDGRVGGAAIDTFAEEPPAPDNPLFAFDAVLATPHCAGASEESLRDLGVGAAENVRAVHGGELPETTVNAEELGR